MIPVSAVTCHSWPEFDSIVVHTIKKSVTRLKREVPVYVFLFIFLVERWYTNFLGIIFDLLINTHLSTILRLNLSYNFLIHYSGFEQLWPTIYEGRTRNRYSTCSLTVGIRTNCTGWWTRISPIKRLVPTKALLQRQTEKGKRSTLLISMLICVMERALCTNFQRTKQACAQDFTFN